MAAPAITLEFPDLPGLAEEFRKLPKSLAAASIGAAVKRALAPAKEQLARSTPVGPTGNLRRGVATKAKRYPKTGAAVAVVGYRKPGSAKPPKSGTKRRNRPADKTQHQFLVEYGTKPRFTKRGAFRGVMPSLRPVEKASSAALPAVKANLEAEMKTALQNALKQLPKYLAARAKKGRA